MHLLKRALRRRGFTLVELIVVILILGILAAIGIVGYTQVTDRAHTAAATANLRQITTAALAAATEDGDATLTRELVLEVMNAATGPAVIEGLGAAAWKLGTSGQAPDTAGEFALGFDNAGDNDTADNESGLRAALVTATGDGQVLAQVFTAQGAGPIVPAETGVTPAVVLGAAPGGTVTPVLSDGEIALPPMTPGPVGVAVTTGDATASVTFDPIPGATSYTVTATSATGAPVTTQVAAPPAHLSALVNDTTYTVTVTATLPDGPTLPSTPVTVTPQQALVISYAATTFDRSRTSQHLAPTVTGAKGALSYAVQGPLPAEVSFDTRTGELTGPAQWGVTLTEIEAGTTHTLAIASDGTVWAWGANGYGQLGTGNLNSQGSPVHVVGGSLAGKRVIAVAAGEAHSLALTSDGVVHAWGSNGNRQLGTGTGSDSYLPTAVTGGTLAGKTVISIAAGDRHSLAVASDGTVHTWGYNAFGQLGNGSSTQQAAPVRVSAGAMGSKQAVAVAAGWQHSLVRATDGTLYGFGYNNAGQLGNNSTTSANTPVLVKLPSGVTAIAMAAGGNASAAVGSNGTAYTWGDYTDGLLGRGTLAYSTPGAVTGGALSGVSVAQVDVGATHMLVRSTTGAVYAFGGNSNGQLGDGTTAPKGTPVRISAGTLTGRSAGDIVAGDSFSIALGTDDATQGWGNRAATRLGASGQTGNQTTPASVAAFAGQPGFPMTLIVTVTEVATGRTASTGSVTFRLS